MVTPSLTVASVSLLEGNSGTKNMDFKFQLSAPSSSEVRFTVDTVNGTATAGIDYQSLLSKVIIIAPGNIGATVSVVVIGDTLVEPNETLTLLVSAK